jgi:GNAT superfamily N-acetyltransferase
VSWTIAPIGRAGGLGVVAQVDAIFFASAATKEFASEEARAAYRELWLDRYRQRCPNEFLVALDASGDVAGYLAGTLFSNRDPLPGPDYYAAFPAGIVEAFPAHLHVNVREDLRGRGVGAMLVDVFRDACREHGSGGLHAVTAADSRAANFFARCGLSDRAQTRWKGRRLAFLGETL